MKKNSLGTKLKQLRVKNELTQDELAEKLSVTRQTISSWERDKSVPDIEMLQFLAKFFKVSSEYLIVTGYSRLKDIVYRNSIWISLLIIILSIVLYSVINGYTSKKYMRAISDYEGACTEVDDTVKTRGGSYFEGMIVENREITLNEERYCIPIKLTFDYNDVEYQFINISKVSIPREFSLLTGYAGISYDPIYERWILTYRLKISVFDDQGMQVSDNLTKKISIDKDWIEEVIS